MAKILVIDDDQGIRHLLDMLLRYKGYHVLLAEEWAEGSRPLPSRTPDVIVLDLKIPDMDGLTVLRHVRSHSISPVIIYSGAWTTKTEQQFRALGINETVKYCNKRGEGQ